MNSTTRFSALSSLLALCVGAACDVDSDGFEDDLAESGEFRQQPIDPSLSSVYDICPVAATFDGIQTQIRYPKLTSCWLPLSSRPLVVLLHGYEFEYDSYTYLLDHLAANGFVAMSVNARANTSPTSSPTPTMPGPCGRWSRSRARAATIDRSSATRPTAHVTKGYVLAFLAAHLFDDTTWYGDYIRGDEVPFGWIAHVASQFSDGSKRLVIDNFEDGTFADPTIGGSVYKTHTTSTTVLDLASELDIQHETQALQLYGQSTGDYVEWTFSSKNVTDHAWLSLRVGHLDEDPGNLSVQLRNGNMWSSPVSLSSHGAIEWPMEMCAEELSKGPCELFDIYAHMGTIRIPLTAFGSHDAVTGVRVLSKTPGTPFVLDSLEFAGSL